VFQNAVRLVNYDHAMTSTDLPPIPRLPSRQSGTTRRAPRARALSRDAIAAAALDIVDREGLDALTMRTVAHALGTGPASLYAHVASKEDLLELVVERVIGEVRMMGEPDPARWQEQLKEAARAIRAVFARHRDVARASFARIPLGENALATSEWMVAVMRAGGLPDQVIAYACDLLPLYVMAVCYEESLYDRETTREDLANFTAEMRNYFASLPPTRFPNLVALAGPLTAGAEGDERFEFGLEVLVRGLATTPG
jgi:AcrR family transcriptional regulator